MALWLINSQEELQVGNTGRQSVTLHEVCLKSCQILYNQFYNCILYNAYVCIFIPPPTQKMQTSISVTSDPCKRQPETEKAEAFLMEEEPLFGGVCPAFFGGFGLRCANKPTRFGANSWDSPAT